MKYRNQKQTYHGSIEYESPHYVEVKGKRRHLPIKVVRLMNKASPGEPRARCEECGESYQMRFMVSCRLKKKPFSGSFFVDRICLKENGIKYDRID